MNKADLILRALIIFCACAIICNHLPRKFITVANSEGKIVGKVRAYGDGWHDDSGAFWKATILASDGGTIYFDRGDYKIR
jgi:hypothetical protein